PDRAAAQGCAPAVRPGGRDPGGRARGRPPHRTAAGHAAAGRERPPGDRKHRRGAADHRPRHQCLRQPGRGLVPDHPRHAVAEHRHSQPAADPALGRGTPVVLPYRVGQGQSVKRTCDGCRAVCRPGAARWPDGPGVLQRHSPAGALMPRLTTTIASAMEHFPNPDRSMTRTPARRLLALALATAIAPVWAQQAVDPQAAFAVPAPAMAQPAGAFTVSDIRIDGLQRIGAGTVFTYLPVERGDTVTQSRIGEAVRALYRTGFFEDIQIGRQGDILVVTVTERPAINKLTLTGNKDIKTEDLTKGLNDIGLSEGETFDRLAVDRVTQELTRQYNNRGKYNVQIDPTVSRLDRNRVDITIDVKEGKAAKIRHINLIGNELFEQDELTDTWESGESNWLSWYRRDDQYSKEKLSGDLEKLHNFYLDRGYVAFSIDNTQVSISPDKRDMFITAGVSEGETFTISSIEVTGDTVLPKEDIERLVLAREGVVFSRALLELSSDAITATLGNIGYAFAQVNTIPEIDRDKRTVGIQLQVVPGPRVNVRDRK